MCVFCFARYLLSLPISSNAHRRRDQVNLKYDAWQKELQGSFAAILAEETRQVCLGRHPVSVDDSNKRLRRRFVSLAAALNVLVAAPPAGATVSTRKGLVLYYQRFFCLAGVRACWKLLRKVDGSRVFLSRRRKRDSVGNGGVDDEDGVAGQPVG